MRSRSEDAFFLFRSRKIYETAQEKYFDTDTNKRIATKRVIYHNKMREMAVVFEPIRTGVGLITIHPLKKHQKENRIQSGRWRKP